MPDNRTSYLNCPSVQNVNTYFSVYFYLLLFPPFHCFLFFTFRNFLEVCIFLMYRFGVWHSVATISRPFFFSTTQVFQYSKVSTKIAAADLACFRTSNSFRLATSCFMFRVLFWFYMPQTSRNLSIFYNVLLFYTVVLS